ncbi:MAG: tRNA lysidine(34) synthetase TilS [Bacteroidales bacterium]|nr:tRNA lysidine(34) synthetase TilS [Bacteroidales bacterium]
MTEQFEQYRKDEKIFSENDRILLAVSGGIDSLVMLDLFHKAGYKIAVAHCNFRLRGREADGDEEFVESLCRKSKLRFYKKRFQTTEYAAQKGLSIQMAARDLRYEWLAGIRENENYDLVATGHNLNDSIETIILNLARGTGINGLTGISPRSGYLIRPILFATRQMIRDYAESNRLCHREDSSNIQTKYKRNKIRHRIIPILEEINPSVLHSIDESSDHLKSAYIIYSGAIESKRKEIFKYDKDSASVKTSDLENLEPAVTWLYELFKQWNFNKYQAREINQLIHADPGKQLFSTSHCLSKDRGKIIITPLADRQEKEIIINSPGEFIKVDLIDSYRIIPVKNVIFSNNNDYAYLDADLIEYPLTIRRWVEGDYFYPLGMQGRKKISDMLIDMKIPLPYKDDVYVLEMKGKIIWLIGIRIDDRFKVTESTSEVLQIIKKND